VPLIPWVQKEQVISNLLDLLGMDGPARWEVADFVLPVAILSDAAPSALERLGIGFAGQGAVAANMAHCQIRNPVNSGVTVRVSGAIISPSAATSVTSSFDPNARATLLTTKFWRDGRLAGLPVAEMRGQANPTDLGANQVGLFVLPNTELFAVPLGILLEQGQGFDFVATTLNVALTCNFLWDEVPFNPLG